MGLMKIFAGLFKYIYLFFSLVFKWGNIPYISFENMPAGEKN